MEKTFLYLMGGTGFVMGLVGLGWAFYPTSIIFIDAAASIVLIANLVLLLETRKLNRQLKEKIIELDEYFFFVTNPKNKNVIVGAFASPESDVDKASREI